MCCKCWSGRCSASANSYPEKRCGSLRSIVTRVMDAAASEFKFGHAGGGRGKISFESPSIVKLSEFKPQVPPPAAAPDFSPASRRLVSAASAPEFKSSFSNGAVDTLTENFSRKLAFDSPSIARVIEFKPQAASTGLYEEPFLPHNAALEGTWSSLLHSAALPHSTLRRLSLCRIQLSAWFRAFVALNIFTSASIQSYSRRIIYFSGSKRWPLEPHFHLCRSSPWQRCRIVASSGRSPQHCVVGPHVGAGHRLLH